VIGHRVLELADRRAKREDFLVARLEVAQCVLLSEKTHRDGKSPDDQQPAQDRQHLRQALGYIQRPHAPLAFGDEQKGPM